MHRYEHGGNVYENGDIRLDFSVNTNPLNMPERVQYAIVEHLPDYIRYPDPACWELCQALAIKHGILPEQVLCGNGAADLLLRICAYKKPRRVLTLAPTFSEYSRVTTLFGGEIIEHPLREETGFELDETIISLLTENIDLVFLCNPNNPTGRLCAPSLLRRIVERCSIDGILVVLDECFLDFTQGESSLAWLYEFSNLLVIKAFTKLYAMAGIRLGYLLSMDVSLLSELASFGATWSVSTVAQVAGIAALKCTDWAEKTRACVIKEHNFLETKLKKLGLTVYTSEANFFMVKSDKPLHKELKNRGILVRNCENFSGLNEHFIRISVKTHDENMELIRSISDILHD